jgi:hypothetical protein
MRRGAGLGIVAATVVAMGAAGTVMAYASWVAPAQAVGAKVVAGTMPQGVTPSAATQDGDAVVSWGAQELRAGVRMQRYVVTAHTVDATPRADIVHTVVARAGSVQSTVFSGSELAGGTWKWAITPQFETWTGPEGKLSGKLSFPAVSPLRTALTAAVGATSVAAAGGNPAAGAGARTGATSTTGPAVTGPAAAGPTPSATRPTEDPTPAEAAAPEVTPSPSARVTTAAPAPPASPSATDESPPAAAVE